MTRLTKRTRERLEREAAFHAEPPRARLGCPRCGGPIILRRDGVFQWQACRKTTACKGGKHTLENLHITHVGCNLSKGNRGGGEQMLLVG